MMVDDDGVHLDEGTIHAWLDGELDAAHRAGIQAHVGRCDQCAALVAEARGLIAGSSRVIGMLDDVSTPIIRPAATPTAGTDFSVWRMLRVTPARASIAAMIVVAVGITLTRGQLSHEVPATTTRLTPASRPMASSPAASSLPTSDSVLASAVAKRLAAEQPPRRVEPAPGVTVPAPPAPASPAPNEDLADATSKIAAGREAVVAQTEAAPPRADRTRVAAKTRSDAAPNSVAVTAATAAEAAGSLARSVKATRASGIVAGQCYRIESPGPATWGSVALPIIVSMDSAGVDARILSTSGTDTEARAYLQYNGADSALFKLRRIGFEGTMTLQSSPGTRTGNLQSSSTQAVALGNSVPRRAAMAASNGAPSGSTQAVVTAHQVACPRTNP